MLGLCRQSSDHMHFSMRAHILPKKKAENGTCLRTYVLLFFVSYAMYLWCQRVEASWRLLEKARASGFKVVSNSFRPLKTSFPSLGTGKKATRWIKECVRGIIGKLGHTGFGHERKIFLNWNETKKEAARWKMNAKRRKFKQNRFADFS